MESSKNISDREAIVHEFEQWQKDFMDGVYKYYSERNGERLAISLDVWEGRFLIFLKTTLPDMARSYKIQTGFGIPIKFYGDPLEGFKVLRSEPIRAFLDLCIDEAKQGHFDEYFALKKEQEKRVKFSLPTPEAESGQQDALLHDLSASTLLLNEFTTTGSDLEKTPAVNFSVWDQANRQIMLSHFKDNLWEGKIVFWTSISVMIISFIVVVAGIVLTFLSPSQPLIISTLMGAISEFLGATFLYIHNKINEQADNHVRTMERINATSMALQILDSIDGNLRNSTKALVVEQLLNQAVQRSNPADREKNSVK